MVPILVRLILHEMQSAAYHRKSSLVDFLRALPAVGPAVGPGAIAVQPLRGRNLEAVRFQDHF